MSERTALYRLFDAKNTLLYVGISANPRGRFKQHKAAKRWWTQVTTYAIEWHDSRDAAEAAERTAIRNEAPRWNTTWNVASPPPMVSSTPDRRIQRLKDSIDVVAAIDDPAIRAAVIGEVLGMIKKGNGALSKLRRDDIRTMRAEGLTYREIGIGLGLHYSRVKQIESGAATGATARARMQRAEGKAEDG